MRHIPVYQKPFAFSIEQRQDLMSVLERYDDRAIALVDAIQLPASNFRSHYQYFVTQNTETPRQARTLLARIARNAKALAEDLQDLDSRGSSDAFVHGCDKLGRRIESLRYLPGELLLVHAAAAGGVGFIGPVQRGRRESSTELYFIAAVANLYRNHLGMRPSTSRGTPFIRFVARVFAHVDPTNPRSISDISKFAAKAIANSKPNMDVS